MKSKADKHREAGTLDAFRARQAASRAGTARYQERAAEAASADDPVTAAADEPVARVLVWRGPVHYPVPPAAARTYAEFPEEAALPANPKAYWQNGDRLYRRPGPPVSDAASADDPVTAKVAAAGEAWAKERTAYRSLLRQARLILRGPHTEQNIVVRELIERIEARGITFGD